MRERAGRKNATSCDRGEDDDSGGHT